MKARRSRCRGFSLIELAVVLMLITVLMTMVIARFSWGGSRQELIGEGRKLGNLISQYREKAMTEETIYALRIDMLAGEYTVVRPKEKSLAAVKNAEPLRSQRLPEGVSLGPVRIVHKKSKPPLVVFFSRRGVLPELAIELHGRDERRLLLKIDPVANDVEYMEL